MKGSTSAKLVLVFLVVVALATGCRAPAPAPQASGQERVAAATEPAATRVPAATGNTVVAEARVVPIQWATLAMPIGGPVAKMALAEGDTVAAGQVLIQLDTTRLNLAVAQAEAALQRAQAQRDEAKAGPRAQEVAIAEAQLDAAKAALLKLQAGPDATQVATAKAEMENAEAAKRQAQAAYDQVKWQPGGEASPQAYQLQVATNNAIAARGRLEAAQKGADPADIAAAQAEIRRAQAQLDLTKAGPRPESIAAAEAEVAARKVALEEAKAALADAELRAPFAGTVVEVLAKQGAYLAPGAPALVLADLSAWQIETTDLTELNIARVQEGSPATITFDAIPGLRVEGKVVRIRAQGEENRGDIVYTAVIAPDKLDPRLRWNMTASVSIKLK
mgnify:CR=1 FL=1